MNKISNITLFLIIQMCLDYRLIIQILNKTGEPRISRQTVAGLPLPLPLQESTFLIYINKMAKASKLLNF